jgi:hypothetical protein
MISQDTIVDQLSALLNVTLSSLQSPEFLEFKNDLTSLTHTVTSLEQEMTASLSAIPLHPYERLKYDYFGTDYEFKKFEDLEESDDIPLKNCLEYIKDKNKELMSTTFHNLTCCEEERINTAFTQMSCDCIVPDYDKQKNYIEFVEMVRNIPIDSVTDTNYLSVAKKILSEYIKVV